jgi:DNA-binding IclR family transcriptional regulator
MEHYSKSPEAGDVPAIRRALMVFDLLAHTRRGLSVSEISRKLTLPKSSTHRILTTLESEKCVHKNSQNGKYYFGVRLFSLNRAALEGLELREEAKPFLIELMKKTGLTVHMAVLEHNQAVLIEKLEPAEGVHIGTWIGRAMDVNSTAAGKALIAFMSSEELSQEINAKKFVRHNMKTIVSMSKLRAELGKVRELGYSVDDEEDELGVRCVGAPIFYGGGKVIAAISVVGTTDQTSEERIELLGEIVRQTAGSISSRLGSSQTKLFEKFLDTTE